tara:strand:- start:266 stop:829 length:564 start_codon:yes stop_codon:yes gene_type:complete
MAEDRNDWVPKFDLKKDGHTITQVPQSDGTIKYFQGNYDEKGEIDRVRINSPGKYLKTPTAQIKDSNGDNVDHRGAIFQVTLDKHGGVYQVHIPIGGSGSGFDDESQEQLKLELTTETASDTVEKADVDVILKTGQWVDIDASEADRVNKLVTDEVRENSAATRRGLRNQLLSVANAAGEVEGYTIR